MRSTISQLALVALLALSSPAYAQKGVSRWQTAVVLSAELNGHGMAPGAKSKSSRRGDIWWTYCVSTDTMTYTAVLRESPTKTGMRANGKIQVSVAKDHMRVRNDAGKQFVLKVIRQTDGSGSK